MAALCANNGRTCLLSNYEEQTGVGKAPFVTETKHWYFWDAVFAHGVVHSLEVWARAECVRALAM